MEMPGFPIAGARHLCRYPTRFGRGRTNVMASVRDHERDGLYDEGARPRRRQSPVGAGIPVH